MNGVVATSQQSRFAGVDSGIDLHQVNISVLGRDLLVDAHVKLNTGVHYGLLGRNGVGKSALLSSLENGSLFSVSLKELFHVFYIDQTLKCSAGGDAQRTVLDELRRRPFKESLELTAREKLEINAVKQSGGRGFYARMALLKMEEDEAQEKVEKTDRERRLTNI